MGRPFYSEQYQSTAGIELQNAKDPVVYSMYKLEILIEI